MQPRKKTMWIGLLWRALLAAGVVTALGILESRIQMAWWLTPVVDFFIIFVVLFVLFYPLTSRERRALGDIRNNVTGGQ